MHVMGKGSSMLYVSAVLDCCYSSSYITKGRQLASSTVWTEPNTIHDVLPEALVGVVLQATPPLQWCPYPPSCSLAD